LALASFACKNIRYDTIVEFNVDTDTNYYGNRSTGTSLREFFSRESETETEESDLKRDNGARVIPVIITQY